MTWQWQDKLWIPGPEDNHTAVPMSFSNYMYNVARENILISRSFSGAACLTYNFSSLCHAPSASAVAYVADADLFTYKYFEDARLAPQYGSPNASVPGKLLSTVCINSSADCSQARVPLDAHSTYKLVIAATGAGECETQSRYVTYDEGSPGKMIHRYDDHQWVQ